MLEEELRKLENANLIEYKDFLNMLELLHANLSFLMDMIVTLSKFCQYLQTIEY